MLNLNELSIPNADGEDVGLWSHNAFAHGADVEVYFKDIDTALVSLILKHKFAVGCVAWLTDPVVLGALSKLHGVAIVVQKEDWLRPDASFKGRVTPRGLRSHYAKINGMTRYYFERLRGMSFASTMDFDAVRCCGVAGGPNETRPRCHHKFLIVGDVETCYQEEDSSWDGSRFVPKAVWTGSFNFTQNACRSFENAVILRSPEICEAYLAEFEQVAALSEPLDWEHEYVCPEWRIGT